MSCQCRTLTRTRVGHRKRQGAEVSVLHRLSGVQARVYFCKLIIYHIAGGFILAEHVFLWIELYQIGWYDAHLWDTFCGFVQCLGTCKVLYHNIKVPMVTWLDTGFIGFYCFLSLVGLYLSFWWIHDPFCRTYFGWWDRLLVTGVISYLYLHFDLNKLYPFFPNLVILALYVFPWYLFYLRDHECLLTH